MFKKVTDKKYRVLLTTIVVCVAVLIISSLACRIVISGGWADVNDGLSEFIFSTFVVLTYMAFFTMIFSLQSMVVLFAIRKWHGRK